MTISNIEKGLAMRFRANLSTFLILLDLVILGTLSGLLPTSRHHESSALQQNAARKTAVPPQQLQAYANLPLGFEANQGQADASIRFLANSPGGNVYLCSTGVVFVFASAPGSDAQGDSPTPEVPPAGKEIRLRMSWPGSNENPQVVGNDLLPTQSNYFIGSDPSRWHRQIPNYRAVRYAAIYPGIDLLFYGNGRELEYDFVVAPGADPGSIALAFTLGGNSREPVDLQIDAQGDLIVSTPGGQLRQRKPKISQQVEGMRKEIPGQYTLRDQSQVGFEVGEYDLSRPLVIDPAIAYSLFIGGSSSGWAHDGQMGRAIAVDDDGNAYVSGFLYSNRLLYADDRFRKDAFVLKLNAQGTALLYATYLGGSDNDYAYGLAIDAAGAAYITGITESTDFPVTDSLQTKSRGGVDAFIAKLDRNGSNLEYSTYLGGSGSDAAGSVAVDRFGNAYVTGETGSKDFPTLNAFQPEQAKGKCVNALDQTICYDAFVTKLSADGRSLVYSTYLGGDDHSSHAGDSGRGIAVDGDGNAIVVGETASENFPTVNALQPHLATQGCNGNLQFGCSDAFITKLNSTGSSLVYSTYLGGNMPDGAAAVAVDSEGNAYVTGDTWSVDFPVYRALQPFYHPQPGGPGPDAFVCKLNPAGSNFFYSTYLGGHDADMGRGIAVDAAGNVYVAGETFSCDFPAEHAWQPRGDITVYRGQCFDAFLTKIVPDGSAFVFSTPLGGRGSDSASGVAVDPHGNAYVTGSTASADFPLSRPLLQDSRYPGAFVIKIAGLPQAAKNPTIGVYREGIFHLKNTLTTGTPSKSAGGSGELFIRFGEPGDIPVVGDWTGDGISKIGVYRQGLFILRTGMEQSSPEIVIGYGAPGDIPVAGDWTGDGITKIGVYRRDRFLLRTTLTTGIADMEIPYGAPGDIPVVGDWTGDGQIKIGVYRQGFFLLRNSLTSGVADLVIPYGIPGDIPVLGDWNGDRVTDLGVFRDGFFLLRTSLTAGINDFVIMYGTTGDLPLAGRWAQ